MMLPTTSARSPLFALAVSAGFALVFIFGFLAWQSPPSISFPKGTGSSASSAHCEAYVVPPVARWFGLAHETASIYTSWELTSTLQTREG